MSKRESSATMPPFTRFTPLATIASARSSSFVVGRFADSGVESSSVRNSAVESSGSPPPTSVSRDTVPLSGSPAATAVVSSVVSGPRIASAAADVSSFCVDAGMTGVSAPCVAIVPAASRTAKHASVPATASSSRACRCWAPTRSTKACGTRRGDQSGVTTAEAGPPVAAGASSSWTAKNTQPAAASTRTIARSRPNLMRAPGARGGARSAGGAPARSRHGTRTGSRAGRTRGRRGAPGSAGRRPRARSR